MSLVLSVYTHGKFPDVIGNVGNGSAGVGRVSELAFEKSLNIPQ